MFSGGNIDSDVYDFSKSENAVRWRGLFLPSLRRVREQVHARLDAKDEALLYVESLCLRILAMLCAKPLPHSVQDIEDKVRKLFPAPIDHWALNEAREINSKKRKCVMPTDRVHTLLQKDVLQYKIDSSVSAFLVAVLEYISADILNLAGNYVRKIKQNEITKEDIEVAMCADKVLMDMFAQSDIKPNVIPSPLQKLPAQRTSNTYEDVVKDLIKDEKQYQRDLHMIIRVFREELIKIFHDSRELEPIFSNILDIYEVTATLLSSLEDVIEMSQDQSAPYVGSCFNELAEAEEFDVYKKYAQDVTSRKSKDALTSLLSKPDAISLMSAGHGFRDVVKYYLPKLLLVPVWHAFFYFDYIKVLMGLSQSKDDTDSFQEVQGLLKPLQCDLENILANLETESCAPLSTGTRSILAKQRMRDLQSTVEHWDKDVGQHCNEFIREDFLGKLGSGKRIAERKVFLFDGLMVLCKPNTKRQVASAGTTCFDYRLKETFFMRNVEVNDRADTEELKNSFEIAPRDHRPPVILIAKNAQHKNDWMADLVMVNTKSMLNRILDSILLDIEKKHPLRMPSPDLYKFAIPDSPDNIVLEERENNGVPLIKGATLCKLVERLTYHIYTDPLFMRTFMTTYRYFCTPQELLSLLIERFNIPDPSQVYQDNQQNADNDGMNCDTDKIHKSSQREDWKRYRKEYVQPVQMRVINVLRHWVDNHFYDFERDKPLEQKLTKFLKSIQEKSMRKWVDSVIKIINRKKEQQKICKQITFTPGHGPPPIEYHLNVPDSEITLLTLHPLELARQLTLLEFELYKNVKPSELFGSPWTKKDKELKSPNLLKIMKHTTNVTRWFEKSIIEAENYEERVAMVTRAIEVMMVMKEINNFNGILSIGAAMGSASVYRLKLTFQGLPARYEKFLEENRGLNDGHLREYNRQLRSINPPCVPFFGRYLTDILHLEEGNPDFLPNTELINFSKRRKVTEIIGEIQQYQNQPYCLQVEPKIRHFLENLDPFKGMSDTDISNFLYNESLRIEPRGCKQAPKFQRKWPNIPLKSPGIKPRRQNNSNNNSNTITSGVLQPSVFGSRGAQQQGQTTSTATPVTTVSSTTTAESGEQSPTAHNNSQAFSVFASVNIPERSSISSGSSSQQTNSWAMTTSSHKSSLSTSSSNEAAGASLSQQQKCENGEVPQLPRKPGAHVWNTLNEAGAASTFSPTFIVGGAWNSSEQQHEQHFASANNIYNNNSENEQQALSSPLPKVIISPRDHETRQQLHNTSQHVHHSTGGGNRSPFQNTTVMSSTLFSKSAIGSHCSPTDSASGSSAGFSAATASPQLATDLDFNTAGAVPVSPHVNVPTGTSHVEYRTAPPPLPPRRKERSESSADMAQKRQAPDAPLLPPRDGELSPPPVPPRLHHSNNNTYLRHSNINSSQTNEFMGSNNLLLPNTSSIMIRRNSAIEKRSSVTAAATCNAQTITTNVPTMTLTSTAAANTADDQQQSISPALSSSTTTSPMTPMTPISPHVLSSGYQMSESSLINLGNQSTHAATTTRFRSQTQSISSILQQQQSQHFHSQSYASHAHHPMHHSPIGGVQQQLHHQQQQPLPPPRSSPKEFISPLTEGTPKLPPKPSLSSNFYNNADKGTMFLYPSTNQE